MELSLDGSQTIYQDIPDLDGYVLDKSDPLVFEKEVIYVGNFEKGKQKFSISENDLVHWRDTHEQMKKLGIKVPMPVEHTRDPEKCRGHIEEYSVKPDSKGRMGLFAKSRFRDAKAAELAKTADVSLYSPVEWNAGGRDWKQPIVHVALTDYPVINGLDNFTVVASLISDEGNDMDLILELCQDLQLSVDDNADPKALVLDMVKKLTAERDDAKENAVKYKKDLELSQAEVKKLTPSDPVPVSQVQLNMLAENREMKLSKLVDDGCISPDVKKGLDELFNSEGDLKLSLNGTNTDDKFDNLVKLLSGNEVVKLRADNGPETLLKLSKADVVDPKKNPLLADMAARSNN